MNQRPNHERARQLRQRGYSIDEVTLHMCEEGRDVHRAEVTAWCNYTVPPKLYEFEGRRATLSEISAEVGIPKHRIEQRMARGLSLIDAITRPAATPQQAARTAASPWRRTASCPGGSR